MREVAVLPFEVFVLEECVHLLMTRPAQRDAVFGLAAALARDEVMLRDHVRRHPPAAEGADDVGVGHEEK